MKTAPMGEHFRKTAGIIRLIAACGALLIAAHLLEAGETQDKKAVAPEDAPVETAMELLDTGSAGSEEPSAAYEAPLLYLAAISGHTQREYEFFQRCLDRLEEVGDERTLPVIEALVNRDIYGDRWDTTEARLIQALRERASELWYQIKWEGADEATKIETALYGIRPDSPVRLHDEVSAAKLRELGEKARPALYELILAPDLSYEFTQWGGAPYGGMAALGRMMAANPVFAPTDEEQVGQVIDLPSLRAHIGIHAGLSPGASSGRDVFLPHCDGEAEAPGQRKRRRIVYHQRRHLAAKRARGLHSKCE